MLYLGTSAHVQSALTTRVPGLWVLCPPLGSFLGCAFTIDWRLIGQSARTVSRLPMLVAISPGPPTFTACILCLENNSSFFFNPVFVSLFLSYSENFASVHRLGQKSGSG